MINLMPQIPAPGPSGDFDRLITLLCFVTDAKAVAQRIADIHQKVLDSADAVAAAEKAKADIATERQALAADREQQANTLATARATHDDKCNQRDRAINERDQQSKKNETAAKDALAKAEATLAEVTARLDRIKAAAA